VRRVRVHWIDSTGPNDTWHEADAVQVLTPTVAVTCGFLVNEGPDFVTVASTVLGNGHYGGVAISKMKTSGKA
jgi:hypothetical protein